MKIAIMDNNIDKGDYYLANKIPIEMLDSNRTAYVNEWQTYQDHNSNLENHWGQVYSLIMVQCTQLLQYNVKQDTAWNATITSYNQLVLIHLIYKTVLAQTEDQYPFATVYDQELSFWILNQSLNYQSTVVWGLQKRCWCILVHWGDLTT